MRPGDGQAVGAGIVSGVVGFGGAFAVVLAGLRGVGASPAEAASGLMVLSVLMGALTVVLAVRTRLPMAIAWSTPGAALLATAGVPDGGFATAVGAFLLCGVLLTLAGLWPWLERTVTRIPRALAAAMLAGVLLPLCLKPFAADRERAGAGPAGDRGVGGAAPARASLGGARRPGRRHRGGRDLRAAGPRPRV